MLQNAGWVYWMTQRHALRIARDTWQLISPFLASRAIWKIWKRMEIWPRAVLSASPHVFFFF